MASDSGSSGETKESLYVHRESGGLLLSFCGNVLQKLNKKSEVPPPN